MYSIYHAARCRASCSLAEHLVKPSERLGCCHGDACLKPYGPTKQQGSVHAGSMSSQGGSSVPLSPAACQFPKAKEVLLKAEQSWLKNTEVCELLLNYVAYNLPVSKEPPHQPPGALHELCLPGMSA